MLLHFPTIALRIRPRQKGHAIISVTGHAIGTACLLLTTRGLAIGLAAALCGLAIPRSAAAQDTPWQREARQAMDHGEWESAIHILDPVVAASPDLLEARRLRAICHREEARVVYDNLRSQYYLAASNLRSYLEAARQYARGRPPTLDQGANYDVTKALFDFEYILARDSSYRDVLTQYARLWRDHRNFDLAISLGEAQLRFRPDLAGAHVELVSAYRNYIAWTRSQLAIRRLRAFGTPYSDYFAGEVYRKDGWMQQADEIFAEILARPLRMPPQPVLLSRARIAIGQERFETGSEFIEQALRVQSLAEAKLLFEDFKDVMTNEEYAAYLRLETLEQHAAFFQRMWTLRNPTPASRINWRLVEHYRRLAIAEQDFAYFGPRTWFNSPDLYKELDYPDVASSNRRFNDKGLIFIRHGEPDDKVLTVNVGSENPTLFGERVAKESWRFRGRDLVFHFESDLGNNWRFLPAITDCKSLEDRRGWGLHYAQLACPIGVNAPRRNEFDLLEGRMRMSAASRDFVMEGLTTDRQSWPEAIESFDFPFHLAAFRGPNGLTDLSLYYALPIGPFSEASSSDTLSVEVGVALHDTLWTPVVEEANILRFLTTDHDEASSIREMRFSVPPDSYRVSLHGDLIGTPLLGGYQFARGVPDFSRSETMMSDAVSAYAILPRTDRVATSRDELQIAANPFHRYALDQPVHVYFELYHLPLDENDRARYEVEFQIEPREEGGGVLGLFRRAPRGLSVSASFEDATPSPIVFSEIDVSELTAGSYTLFVRVTIEGSGAELVRQLPLELVEQAE